MTSLRVRYPTRPRCPSSANALTIVAWGALTSHPDSGKRSLERPNHFPIVAGHPRTEGEDIVDTLGPYEIVEKPEGQTAGSRACLRGDGSGHHAAAGRPYFRPTSRAFRILSTGRT